MGEVTRGHLRSNRGKKSKYKKVNTMGIVGKVFNCRFQLFEFFVIRGHWRSLEVIKGQLEVKNKKWKNSTIWILLERSSIVEFNYWKIFVIRGHKRSTEVIKGQMGFKKKKKKKSTIWVLMEK